MLLNRRILDFAYSNKLNFSPTLIYMQLFTRLTSHLKRMRRLQIIALIVLATGTKGISQDYSIPLYYPLDSVPVLNVNKFGFEHDSLSWMLDIYSQYANVLSISTDNWKTWRSLKIYNDKFEVTGSDTVFLYNERTYNFDGSGIYRTVDFGTTWDLLEGTSVYKNQYPTTILDLEYHQGRLMAVYYDEEESRLKILYSPDGGDTFTTQNVANTDPGAEGWKITAQSATKWWLHSKNTGIFRYTEDAGQTWQELPYNVVGTKLHVLGEGELVMTNGYVDFSGTIQGRSASVSSDGGATWKEQMMVLYPFSDSLRVFQLDNWIWLADGTTEDPFNKDPYIYNNFPADIVNMYMVQSTGDIYVVLDNGMVQVSSDQMNTFEEVTEVNQRSAINMTANTGISFQGRSVFKTFDGGKNWDTLKLPGGYFDHDYVYHSADSIFFAIHKDSRLKIYFTSDLGETFTAVDSTGIPSGRTYGDFRQNKDGSFLYKTIENRLFLMYDGLSILLSEDPNLEAYNFYDRNHGLVITRPNSLSSIRDIAITHDGGESWDTTHVTLPQNGAPVYMLGNGNVLMKLTSEGWKQTANDGETWEMPFEFDDPVYTSRSHLMFIGEDSLVVYRYGYYDQVFSSIDGGVSWSSESQWAYDYMENLPDPEYSIFNKHAVSTTPCETDSDVHGVEVIQEGDQLSLNKPMIYTCWSRIPETWMSEAPELDRRAPELTAFAEGFYKVWAIDSTGCVFSPSIFVDEVLSVEEQLNLNTLVYPVPVLNGELNIDTEHAIQNLNLYDQTGRLVKTFDPAQQSHAVSDLDSGIYILKISTQEGELSRRISIFN